MNIIIGNIPLRRFFSEFSAPTAPPAESPLADGPLQALNKDQYPDLRKLSLIFICTRLKTILIPQRHHHTRKLCLRLTFVKKVIPNFLTMAALYSTRLDIWSIKQNKVASLPNLSDNRLVKNVDFREFRVIFSISKTTEESAAQACIYLQKDTVRT